MNNYVCMFGYMTQDTIELLKSNFANDLSLVMKQFIIRQWNEIHVKSVVHRHIPKNNSCAMKSNSTVHRLKYLVCQNWCSQLVDH